MDPSPELGFNTQLAHFGEGEKDKGAVAPAIYQTSLFVFDTIDEFISGLQGNPQGPPYHYSRIGNPSVDLAERKIAQMEGTDACKLFGTGQGAITAAIMSCVEAGGHIVAVDSCYGPTRILLSEYLTKFGVKVTFVTGIDPQEILDAIRPETTAVYLESPSSLLFRLQEIETVTQHCREKGIATLIDNTHCTPFFSNPAKLGVDIVLHSATKYLAGHSDLTAGALCTSQDRIDRLSRLEVNLLGSLLAPFPAWLLTRGMRTLGVRMLRHQETGNLVAQWVEEHLEVEEVVHVGLPSFAQRDLFLRQMRGSSSLFSFHPKTQDREKIVAFVESLELFQIGVSWGGYESLVVPIELKPDNWSEPRWIVRLYCGLEEPEDLIADLQRAMPLLT
ncbi:MAG: aminotransferase class I/II-fold pyridoxal phosphate-dependent enzyme [Chlorobia bacterium]|nr:aminotransferase class I/II-fold pyridoxal phosphate-dependent enzyme [Fimbriimonadaceae bacterium]